MKNTEIKKVYRGDDNVVALLFGDDIVYKPVTKRKNILAGSFSEPGEYTVKLNSVNVLIETDEDGYFELEVSDELTSCSSMFYQRDKLISITSLPDTSNVTSMSLMFGECKVPTLDLSNLVTSKVKSMYGMFYSCTKLTSLDLSNFNTENVTNMGYMFGSSYHLGELNVSSFNTENVTNMSSMFYQLPVKNLDLSNFNTENVTNMSSMFGACKVSTLNVSSFNTENVTNMKQMFMSTYYLTDLDISSFNTSKLVDISNMFDGCSVENLHLGNFNLSNISDPYMMQFAFYCKKLTNVTGQVSGIKCNFNISSSPLTHASALVFLNGLAEISSKRSITFKSTTYDTLTEEDIALATSRGWSVVSA